MGYWRHPYGKINVWLSRRRKGKKIQTGAASRGKRVVLKNPASVPLGRSSYNPWQHRSRRGRTLCACESMPLHPFSAATSIACNCHDATMRSRNPLGRRAGLLISRIFCWSGVHAGWPICPWLEPGSHELQIQRCAKRQTPTPAAQRCFGVSTAAHSTFCDAHAANTH